MGEALPRVQSTEPPGTTTVFERIAADLHAVGYSLIDDALPSALLTALVEEVRRLGPSDFHDAAIGREREQILNGFVRRDEIRWIDGDTAAERDWLAWTGELRAYLNQRLFLGLFSYESHFAHYPPGAFYKRHVDAFRGEANRILTTVCYLNPDWGSEDGGELLLYPESGASPLARVLPCLGTLAVFLSEEFPHEVRPARRDRYSIAGWFRVNASTAGRADPPR